MFVKFSGLSATFPVAEKKIKVCKCPMLNLTYPASLIRSLLSHLVSTINCPRNSGTDRWGTWGLKTFTSTKYFFSCQKPFTAASRRAPSLRQGRTAGQLVVAV